MEELLPKTQQEKKVWALDEIMSLIDKNGGVAKTADIVATGIDYRRLMQFVEEGRLVRVKNGYYSVPKGTYNEEQMITSMYPDGILTMETALFYHGYLKERPYGWSIAINKNTSKSRFKLDYPAVTPYYTEPAVLEIGVEKITIAGNEMGIYSKDRLVCDVLKYEEKIDREYYKKGLLAYINDETKNVAKLMEYAKERKVINKVRSVIGVWL
ncbi:MAG: type IV toxin-antitoxin system AbiEi family antitoxin domain-containing protein [Lachnospiraceae bacterium]|nr:type IV toxin-antitoxin system AbiEi family antitoxin domain-containing protein [Lachnospiraceae bacterium]